MPSAPSQVPGLAENRPSVLRGDSLFVKPSDGSSRGREWEGVVHEVRQEEVRAGMHGLTAHEQSRERNFEGCPERGGWRAFGVRQAARGQGSRRVGSLSCALWCAYGKYYLRYRLALYACPVCRYCRSFCSSPPDG